MSQDAEIEAAVRQELASFKVSSVETEADTNRDDAPVLRVRIVFDDAVERLDYARMNRVIDRLLAVLDARGSSAFPIISYIDLGEDPRAFAAE